MQQTRLHTQWLHTPDPIPYPTAVAFMEARVAEIAHGTAGELVWLLEHPPLYTAGTSARPADLATSARFPVYQSGRGGQYTYHGPGQRVAYVLLDLNRRGRDLRAFIEKLQQWVIATLAHFDIRGVARAERVGVWVPRPALGAGREDKIAAIGIRVRRWVSYHGLSLNVCPDLGHYADITPCGIDAATSGFGVTSLADLGVDVSMGEVDAVLRTQFEEIFGPTRDVHAQPRRLSPQPSAP